MFRGTLRYPGWCETLRGIARLGFLDETRRDGVAGLRWKDLVARMIASTGKDLRRDLASFLGVTVDSPVISRLEWLGLLSSDPLPQGATSYLDALTERMLGKMQYAPGERDMLVMQHEFTVRLRGPPRADHVHAGRLRNPARGHVHVTPGRPSRGDRGSADPRRGDRPRGGAGSRSAAGVRAGACGARRSLGCGSTRRGSLSLRGSWRGQAAVRADRRCGMSGRSISDQDGDPGSQVPRDRRAQGAVRAERAGPVGAVLHR